MRETHPLVDSCTNPNQEQGVNLQPRYLPLAGIEPEALMCFFSFVFFLGGGGLISSLFQSAPQFPPL